MIYVKANMEISKALSKGDIVRGHDLDDDLFIVTTNGYYAYIIPKKEIIFDIKKVQILTRKMFEPGDYLKNSNELKPTMHYIKPNRDYCRRFDGKGYHVYLNDEFLKRLEKDYPYKYYQDVRPNTNMSLQPILAAVKMSENKETNKVIHDLAMLILPIRVLDEEGDD